MTADHEMNAIEEAAAVWMIERDRGLTAERERELQRWLEADARHAAAFAALEETWALMGEGTRGERADVVELAGAESGRSRWPQRSRWGWGFGTLAAAAAIVLGFVGLNRSWPPADSREAAMFARASATEVGVVRTMTLPDGSAIQLNTDSAVDVRFEAAVRRVTLTRGEAHFTVAKDATRPFIVTAGGVDVRVVGTVFNVRLRAEAVDVLVTEGKVRVASPEPETRVATSARARGASEALAELTAGQRVSVALHETPSQSHPAPVAVTDAEIRQTLAWQARRLDFDASPLSEIVAEVNRYNQHKLVLDDPRLKERKFGGSFPANDHATLVRMLEADFGVVAERREGVTILRLQGP